MRRLKWALFLSFIIFYAVPRIVYVIKVLLPKDPEEKDHYKRYAHIADIANQLKFK